MVELYRFPPPTSSIIYGGRDWAKEHRRAATTCEIRLEVLSLWDSLLILGGGRMRLST